MSAPTNWVANGDNAEEGDTWYDPATDTIMRVIDGERVAVKATEGGLTTGEEQFLTDLDLLVETAHSWAGEYGFSMPAAATEVYLAVHRMVPERYREDGRRVDGSDEPE